ncbi:Glutathione transferase protein [Dioscorea alata]|uniref:Glutathione transferase protein n=1 Tax=Dioscorea alata TaxID=55571 RepID=A0ACB7WPN5_DIOAL|nr:Glutathione transferase protein [Dioscorea alata]
MASVKVFGSPTSADVARVLACLFEKDVDFQLIRIDGFKGKERKPDYLKLQPSGQPLTFEHGSKTLVESREICRYIAEKFADQGNKDLLGKGTLERASIEQWLQTEMQSFDPPTSALVFNLAFAQIMDLEPDQQVITKSKAKLANLLDVYEQRLEETNYLAGDKFTLADLSHLPNAQYLMAATKCGNLFRSRKRVSNWWDRISGRSSWRKVVEMQEHHPSPMF